MVTQYPHKLIATVVTGSTRDALGKWIQGPGSTKELNCRAEPNSGNGVIIAADGAQLKFDFVVYMPVASENLSIGSKVKIYDGDQQICDAVVKKFYRGQLNARAWL